MLNKLLENLVVDLKSPFLAALTEDIHILPDFHGNRLSMNLIAPWIRSPISDPKAKGVIYGLTLDTSEQQLSILYLATVQAIAYGTRHIVEHSNSHGHKVL
uniref:Carbohydrate kinase FGGY C-terminal domain-containing protein n=1 Tax=Cucumis melo TaxID=3656 RepID=A0A9I9E4D5_CUCME